MSIERDFRDFLEGIDPEDFDRSSALASFKGCTGPAGFNRFIQERLVEAEDYYDEQQGRPDPLVYLANDDRMLLFEGYPDETMLDMFTRLHREAMAMSASMVFIAMRLYAANQSLPIDGMDSAAIKAAIEEGLLTQSYAWYAEHRVGDDRDRRSGVWPIIDGKLGERVDGSPDNAPLFHSVLA